MIKKQLGMNTSSITTRRPITTTTTTTSSWTLCILLMSSILFMVVNVTSGFAPKYHQPPPSSAAAAAAAAAANKNHPGLISLNMANQEAKNLLDTTDFENVNLLRLLGLRRVKKFVKKRQSIARKAAKTSFLDQQQQQQHQEQQQSPDIKDQTTTTTTTTTTTSEKKPLKLIIAGAPASGKGTQCEIIKKNYGVVHLSTGDMLRAAVAAGTEVGKQAKEFMDAGKLVPDSVIIGVVANRLEQEDCKTQGWLLDGFPRTPGQADALASAGISADCFIFLNVPDDILVDRVVGRRTDPVTGKIYHMTYSPPDDEEVLARLEQRSDDTEDKVKVRLEQFHANVDAVKGSYSDIAVEIDGTASPEDVSKAIAAAIASRVVVSSSSSS